ncbi:MAG: hypothetical protein H7Y20_14415 [Bryobacteraceae bacterium]|nr:hypothetical protein [Bryobacteraceae bacterium]
MFFRREKPRVLQFSDRTDSLKQFGFTVQPGPSGQAIILKHGCAATIDERGGDSPVVSKAGVLVGKEIGYLVNGGYQQFFMTPGGKKLPALAQQLRALHDFQEDLKEALGIESLYNTALGTTSDQHLYDRVEDRDAGVRKDFDTLHK